MNNKPYIILLIICPMIVLSLHAQNKLVGYYDVVNKDQVQKNEITLFKQSGYYSFCFALRSKEVLKDTVIDGADVKLITIEDTTGFSECYAYYSFHKRSDYVYLVYYDSLSKSKTKYKQYPVKTGKTADFIYLFAKYNGHPNTDGKVVFKGDTLIKNGNGLVHACYRIEQIPSKGFDNKEPLRQVLYIDKKTFLPIRYEFINAKDQIQSYYIFRPISSPTSQQRVLQGTSRI